MRRSPKVRKASSFSESLNRQLRSYALAASAAGIGVLALAQPAEGKIIYTAIHKIIKLHEYYNLDLNHDGKTDFTIINQDHNCSTDLCHSVLSAPPRHGNPFAEGRGAWAGNAYALKAAEIIGPQQLFSGVHMLIGSSGSCYGGSWCNVKNRYLGLSFWIHGRIHYGWARLSVKAIRGVGITATITGYAYETIAGKAIIAGKTNGPGEGKVEAHEASLTAPSLRRGTLGMLALGSSAVSMRKLE